MAQTRQPRHGFTLIEMMAVVAIFALLAAFVAPQVGRITGRGLQRSAHDIGSQVQLARERTILTGTPHRLLLDLESQGYRLEQWTTEALATGQDPDEDAPVVAIPGQRVIELAAPRDEERDWYPVAGRLGSFVWLDDGLRIAAVERAGDVAETGDVGVAFAWDGTTEPTLITLTDDGERQIEVDVLPLADAVRIVHVD